MKRKRFLLPLFFLLVFVLLLPLCGCGGGDEEGEEPEQGTEREEFTIDEFFAKAEGIEGYSFDYVITDDSTGSSIEGKMWIQGMKQRIEMDMEGGNFIQIADYEAKKAYSYMPEQKTAFEIDLTELQAPETPTDYVENTDTTGSEFLGTEEIDGIECYKFSVVPKDENASAIYWLHGEYGMPVKIEMTVEDAVSVTEFKNFEVGAISKDMFTLPGDVHVQSISDMMQNLPAAP
jgi:outer membrane lipoprotein-sorting protein